MLLYAEERQQEILRRARADGRDNVVRLTEDLAVTSETIRRDLSVLERAGVSAPGARRRDPDRAAGFEPALVARDAVQTADLLITDTGLDDAVTEELEQAGLRVLRA